MDNRLMTFIGIGAILAIAIVVILRALTKPKKSQKQVSIAAATAEPTQHYVYELRPRIVSNYELLFYHVLKEALNDTYMIVPQAHLSMFLNHKIYNHQNWSIALSKINKKSVDFLICNKETLQPLFAIELDDKTHNQPKRIERDIFVNEILGVADMPLVRFRANEWPHAQAVREKLSTAFPTK